MASPARTPAAGLPHASWPVRPAAPPPAAPTEKAPRPVVAPPEERELDPRTIARASLAAGRNRSLWWTLGGIAACVAVAFVTDAVVGSVALGVLMLAYAVVRAVGPAVGPVAVSVRSKPLDVVLLATGGTALIVLASLLPSA